MGLDRDQDGSVDLARQVGGQHGLRLRGELLHRALDPQAR